MSKGANATGLRLESNKSTLGLPKDKTVCISYMTRNRLQGFHASTTKHCRYIWVASLGNILKPSTVSLVQMLLGLFLGVTITKFDGCMIVNAHARAVANRPLLLEKSGLFFGPL